MLIRVNSPTRPQFTSSPSILPPHRAPPLLYSPARSREPSFLLNFVLCIRWDWVTTGRSAPTDATR
jgi:hypothetical protein